MKQEMICPDCSRNLRDFFTRSRFISQTKFVEGLSVKKHNCDNCGTEITPMDKCTALSIFSDKEPYQEGWEKEFVFKEEEWKYPIEL